MASYIGKPFSFKNLVVVGVVVRLLLLPFLGHPFDVYIWHLLCSDIFNGLNPYEALPPANMFHLFYPPMWLYTMLPFFSLYLLLTRLFTVSPITVPLLFAVEISPWPVYVFPDQMFTFIIKLPLVIADVLEAFLLRKIIYTYTEKLNLANHAAALWLLNPYVIWTSSSYGMFDVLPAFFGTLALWYLVKNRVWVSAIFLGVAVGYKLYPLMVLPVIIAYLAQRMNHWIERCLEYIAIVS
ncbi:hypothetical protein KEJ17_05800, partial [Candidatus Bathyarchaeota archaeon]|nr:hypothetical protein [Candidatus Bathyarchaeota archaeon]